MPLDHYLPATYLASFSAMNTLPRRERVVVVGDIQQNRCFQDKVCNLAAEKNFYSLFSNVGDSRIVDKVWAEYEAEFSVALERLIQGTIDAVMWARVLVPFVAGILVRGPDFNRRFGSRIEQIGLSSDSDNTNSARLFELQRLLAPVSVARWLVLSTVGYGDAITNDVGFVPFGNSASGDFGISIPLSQNHVLAIVPKRVRPIVVAKGNKWYPIIEYVKLHPGNHLELNATLASGARRFIFGSNEGVITPHLNNNREGKQVPEPGQLGFISGPLAVVHEFTWHRLVSAISKHPKSKDSWHFEIDWQALSEGWIPPVFFPTNLPKFPPALIRNADMIFANLYDVPGFTKP